MKSKKSGPSQADNTPKADNKRRVRVAAGLLAHGFSDTAVKRILMVAYAVSDQEATRIVRRARRRRQQSIAEQVAYYRRIMADQTAETHDRLAAANAVDALLGLCRR
jgi:hypothetical protein